MNILTGSDALWGYGEKFFRFLYGISLFVNISGTAFPVPHACLLLMLSLPGAAFGWSSGHGVSDVNIFIMNILTQ